jgi:hypothetical protein
VQFRGYSTGQISRHITITWASVSMDDCADIATWVRGSRDSCGTSGEKWRK